MFDSRECKQLREAHSQCVQAVKNYRLEHGASLNETPQVGLYAPFRGLYRQLAGLDLEFDPFEVVRRHCLARWHEYQHEAH